MIRLGKKAEGRTIEIFVTHCFRRLSMILVGYGTLEAFYQYIY